MTIKVGNRSFDNADQLEALVISAATQYEATGYVEDADGVEVTDPEYDELHRALKTHKPSSKVFKGASPSQAANKGKTIKHDPPLTSINKADGDLGSKQDIYNTWLADCTKRSGKKIGPDDLAQEYKHDGNCVRINYVKGKLVSAGSRNRDGSSGTDITEHIKHVHGVFLELPLPLTLSLNGEVECWIEDFDVINAERDAAGDEPYKNPRNYTAGVLGRDDSEQVKDARLRISYHSISGFDDWEKYYKTVIERAKWANGKDGLNLQDTKGKGYFVRSMPHKIHQLQIMEDKAKDMPYYVDGVVLKINDLEVYEELGHTGDDITNPPRAALAWKFAEEEKSAKVGELEWNASRTGRIVPTAIFAQPVRLADTDVTRATCNNYGWATNMGVGPGTVVKVKKAGKIIPNVCGVISGAVTDIGAPKECPTCKSKLEISTSAGGNTDLLCKNKDCGAKQIHSWLFYLVQMGGKGLGASALEKVLRTGKVNNLANLYDLTLDDLVKAGFSERQAVLALATIFMVPPEKDSSTLYKNIEAARAKKQKVEAWRFFKALGISGAGESAGKALVKHYGDFDRIRSQTSASLQQVSGIGSTTADAIEVYFHHNKAVVDGLLEHIELELPKSGKLNGKSFCLTGSFDEGKKHWQTEIENQGGNCVSSVGKDTNFLLMQHGKTDGSPSDKEVKAAKYGTKVISVDDLKKML